MISWIDARWRWLGGTGERGVGALRRVLGTR